MTAPNTAREVLIAEAIGELGRLLDRAEALHPQMAASHQALVSAHAQLAAQLAEQLAAFDAQLTALTEKAKAAAVRHILARTDEAARRSVDTQTRVMVEAAQAAFKAEVEPALRRLVTSLQRLMDQVDRPWDLWLTHAATAASSAVTSAAVTWFIVNSFAFR